MHVVVYIWQLFFFFIEKLCRSQGMVVHAFSLGTWEAEAGDLSWRQGWSTWVLSHPELYGRTLALRKRYIYFQHVWKCACDYRRCLLRPEESNVKGAGLLLVDVTTNVVSTLAAFLQPTLIKSRFFPLCPGWMLPLAQPVVNQWTLSSANLWNFGLGWEWLRCYSYLNENGRHRLMIWLSGLQVLKLLGKNCVFTSGGVR
jgi:hypothetical protein